MPLNEESKEIMLRTRKKGFNRECQTLLKHNKDVDVILHWDRKVDFIFSEAKRTWMDSLLWNEHTEKLTRAISDRLKKAIPFREEMQDVDDPIWKEE